MTKEEILLKWKEVYRGRHGIPQSRDISDSELLEQFAIEQWKGNLHTWLKLAMENKESEFYSQENNLDELAKDKGIICWIVPCSFSYPPHKVTWAYEIEILPYSEMGKFYCESEHKSNMFYPYQEWDTYDEAKKNAYEKAMKLFDEWSLAVTPNEVQK